MFFALFLMHQKSILKLDPENLTIRIFFNHIMFDPRKCRLFVLFSLNVFFLFSSSSCCCCCYCCYFTQNCSIVVLTQQLRSHANSERGEIVASAWMHNVSDTKRETHDTSDYIRGDIFFVCMSGHNSNFSVTGRTCMSTNMGMLTLHICIIYLKSDFNNNSMYFGKRCFGRSFVLFFVCFSIFVVSFVFFGFVFVCCVFNVIIMKCDGVA